MRRQLYYGDCLDVLRSDAIEKGSIDLIYLDPPFNSKATYNILFKAPVELGKSSQIIAFEDTWHWTLETQSEFSEILNNRFGNVNLAKLVSALYDFLGPNDFMAYVVHISLRLLEIHNVLKNDGTMYLHCDMNASHYIKLILDSIFDKKNFRAEIIWEKIRTGKSQSSHFPKHHDTIFCYSSSDDFVFYAQRDEKDQNYIDKYFIFKEADGRHYRLIPFSQGTQGPPRRFGNEIIPPPDGKHWIWSQDRIDEAFSNNMFVFTKPGKPSLKFYLDDYKGKSIGTMWTDIPPINSQAKERLGYPTQKPIKLLERIINTSSNEGDTVLDPFCGCGTTVHASEKLSRNWIGIDIAYLAIAVIKDRLIKAFPDIENEIEIKGIPKSYADALELAKASPDDFQLWVTSLLKAMPGKKGADGGRDGFIFFQYIENNKIQKGQLIIEVKGGERIGVDAVHKLISVIEGNKAQLGVFISAHKPTRPMLELSNTQGFIDLGKKEYPRLQVIWLKDLLEGKMNVLYPESGHLDYLKSPKEELKDNSIELYS